MNLHAFCDLVKVLVSSLTSLSKLNLNGFLKLEGKFDNRQFHIASQESVNMVRRGNCGFHATSIDFSFF